MNEIRNKISVEILDMELINYPEIDKNYYVTKYNKIPGQTLLNSHPANKDKIMRELAKFIVELHGIGIEPSIAINEKVRISDAYSLKKHLKNMAELKR